MGGTDIGIKYFSLVHAYRIIIINESRIHSQELLLLALPLVLLAAGILNDLP